MSLVSVLFVLVSLPEEVSFPVVVFEAGSVVLSVVLPLVLVVLFPSSGVVSFVVVVLDVYWTSGE